MGVGEWGLQSVHHTLFLLLLRMEECSPAAPWGLSHSRPVLHELLGNSPPHTFAVWVTLPQDAVLQGQAAPAGATLSPTGAQPLLRPLSAPAWTPPGATNRSLFPRALPVLQGHSCFTIILTTGCRQISAPVPGAAHALPSTLT